MTVSDYYFTQINELSSQKRFHFGSRLAAWQGDERALALLRDCRSHMVPEPLSEDGLTTLFTDILSKPVPANTPAHDLRAPYFAKYPRLFGIHLALFRLRHLRFVYGIDARATFDQLVPQTELQQLEQALLQDQQAMRTLSTYVVNFWYLKRILFEQDKSIDVQNFYRLGQEGYDLHEPEQLRLLLYLYTHCIIADSNFYVRQLPTGNSSAYYAMLAYLENYIQQQPTSVSLDTKLEFLVCARITKYPTTLAQSIDAECQRSVSPEGNFIIDTHNAFANNQHKKTFDASEHRNVLFIMSGSEYQPHDTLV